MTWQEDARNRYEQAKEAREEEERQQLREAARRQADGLTRVQARGGRGNTGLPADLVAALGKAQAQAASFNPRMPELRARLLQEGGREVLFAYAEPDVDDLLASGQRFAHRVQGLPGPEPTGCHHNVIAGWQADPRRFRIATGYGLNPFGIWVQHSWLVDAQMVIYETTTSFFETYFGIVYSEEQARRFARDVPRVGQRG